MIMSSCLEKWGTPWTGASPKGHIETNVFSLIGTFKPIDLTCMFWATGVSCVLLVSFYFLGEKKIKRKRTSFTVCIKYTSEHVCTFFSLFGFNLTL